MRDPEEVLGWLKKAESDYQGAIDLSRRRIKPLSDLVCFHCQQAAEKYLKAFLIFHERSFPKTHDLLLLLTLAESMDTQLALYREWFDIFNPYSVQFRYPGDESTREESRTALKTIKRIRQVFLPLFPAALRKKWFLRGRCLWWNRLFPFILSSLLLLSALLHSPKWIGYEYRS